MAPTPIENPFPGLRSFEPHQADLFFGRDEQIEELADRLQKHRFVAVVGTSGSGKSSLVRAGLIPVLERSHVGFMASRWRIAILRPGGSATVELASALSRSFGDPHEIVLKALRASSAGLAKYARQRLDEGESLLLLVDQFEELFRYRSHANAEHRAEGSAAFVKLLLAASGHNDHPLPGLDDVPVYVVITLRSDFLGRCSQFRGLPEVLNDSQYLVPRMTREEQREAIEGPVGMASGRISAPLVQRLLNEVGDNPDQLPVLQHVLMRTWEHSREARSRGSAIEIQDYEAVGGMSEALNRDADHALAALHDNEETKTIARRLFQRLVEPGAQDEETRHPTPLSEIVAVMGGHEANVRQVIEVFRGRGFITISGDEDPIVDISHESLIRNWKQLGEWVLQESRSAAIYRRLADTAELYGKGEAGLLRDPQLQLALNWREETHPNEAWAQRYHPGFTEAMSFLDESRNAHQNEIKRTERQRERELRRARLTALVFGGLFLVAAVAFVAALAARRDAIIQRARSNRLLYDANIYSAQGAAGAGQFLRTQSLLAQLLDPGLKELRGFEWFYLWRVVQNEPTLTGHSASVSAIAYSPDGKTLATGSLDNTVKLWDTSSCVATLEGHSGSVSAVAFSPDGKTLATSSSDTTVKLWDTASHELVETLTGHKKPVKVVAFSPDGKTLATGSDDQTVKLWDSASRKEFATLPGHSKSVSWLAFSPDGKTLATVSEDSTVKLWDIASRRELATLTGHSGPVWAVAFSPDGRTLATSGDDGAVKLWNTASRKELETLKAHQSAIYVVAFSPDGTKLATGSLDDTSNIKLWDAASRRELATLTQSGSVLALAFSPNSQTLATVSSDNTVKLWDTSSHLSLTSDSGPVVTVAFSPDGQTLATGEDETVRLWDIASRKQLFTRTANSGQVRAVAFSPDGKTLATSNDDGIVKLWDAVSGEDLATLKAHAGAVSVVAFSPDGKILATCSLDSAMNLKLWDTASREEMATLTGHLDSVRAMAFSPDGKTLVTGSNDKTVKLWDTASRKELATFTGHSNPVSAVAFSPDGATLATGSLDTTVKLWDTASRKELATLTGHSGSVLTIAFSPDGKTLASGSGDKTVKLWDMDIASRKELATLSGHSDSVWAVAFSPDGKTLATASLDTTVKLWFAATENEVATRRNRPSN
ncbi:MAG TPA: WD40 repeat domain-containing protein [Blastocatellia bacterium]|nr:WD40 repeat domain-containing protein [Blastocatellia bacterium]